MRIFFSRPKNVIRAFSTGAGAGTSTSTIPLTNIKINGKELQVPKNITIMQACSLQNIDIPRFCYHEKLSIAGNCRMCLVEVNSSPKLVASCAAPIQEGMSIVTNNLSVKKGREGVMELLLANHPLDCPICDQGGECDLQDQSMAFGTDRSRFNLASYDKRATEDKDIGPIIKTSMNRCIQCTRCVRFAIEVAGMDELGTAGRGNDLEISTYVEGTALTSPLTGNLADLCPVGALLPRPTAFRFRPWELRKTKGIDVMDAMGSSISIDSRGQEVMRILPVVNEAINEEWATDKVRFSIDSLKIQRLLSPYWKGKRCNWSEAISRVVGLLSSLEEKDKVSCLIGPFADVESIWAMRKLIGAERMFFGAPTYKSRSSSSSSFSSLKVPSMLRMNQSFTSLQTDTDTLLLIGTDPEKEAPLLAAKLRRAYLAGTLKNVAHLNVSGIRDAYLGSKAFNASFVKMLQASKRPSILIGEEYLWKQGSTGIAEFLKEIPSLFSDGLIGVSFLMQEASRFASIKVGGARPLDPEKSLKGTKVLFLLGSYDHEGIREMVGGKDDADNDSDDANPNPKKEVTIVYMGSNGGDEGSLCADLLLPSPAWTEKTGTHMNMEGRTQRSIAAISGPAGAREEWRTLKIINDLLPSKKKIQYQNLDELWDDVDKYLDGCIDGGYGYSGGSSSNSNSNSYNDTVKEATGSLPLLKVEPQVAKKEILDFLLSLEKSSLSLSSKALASETTTAAKPYIPIPCYYQTNVLSRLSPTIAKCIIKQKM